MKLKLPKCPHCGLIAGFDHTEKCIEKVIYEEKQGIKEGWIHDWSKEC